MEFFTRCAKILVLYKPYGLLQKAVIIQRRVFGDEELPSDRTNKVIIRPGDLPGGDLVKLEIHVQRIEGYSGERVEVQRYNG